MNRRGPALALAVLLLPACGGAWPPPRATAAHPAEPAPRPVGGDRDAQGCLVVAGYSWCQRSARCERPWELARREGLADADALAAFCAATDRPAP
mgnify:CR=1 FL=1